MSSSVLWDSRGANWSTKTVILRRNGTMLYSHTFGPNRGQIPFADWHIAFTIPRTRTAAPVVTANPPLVKMVGNTVNWTEGITARWGYTTTNLIPSMGAIETTTLTAGTDPYFTSNGSTFTHIGHKSHSYRIRDNHSLSASYPNDNTSTTTSRFITVKTSARPSMTMTYPTGTTNTQGISIAGQSYSSTTALLPCGGEGGWTNKNVQVTVAPNGILGDFQTILNLSGTNTIMNPGGNAVRNHGTATAPADKELGTLARGVLTQRGTAAAAISNELSDAVTGRIKIDKTNPSPSVEHNGGTNFADTSTDALSGISTRAERKTKVALVTTVGLVTPSDSEFHDFDNVPVMPPGVYSLWVRATDKAGNTHTVRQVNNNLRIANVSIRKDTDAGATLHIDTCGNRNLVTRPGSCQTGCQVGANVDLRENTELTYTLRLKNSDTATVASGTFNDILPAGFVPIGTPTRVNITGSGNISGVTSTLGGSRYTVAGSYTLNANAEIEIRIRGTLPALDTDAGATNIVGNQASITWQIGSASGNSVSNYANHRITEAPSVNISKRTFQGATLHEATCVNHNQITTFIPCTASCQVGTNVELMERTEAVYVIELRNSDLSTSSTGSFTDELPAGFVPDNPWWNITNIGSLLNVNRVLVGNRYTVTGDFALTGNAWIRIHIPGTLPAFDATPGATNIASNQARISYQIGSGASEVNGTAVSNYANHRINPAPTIRKRSNWGAAVHANGCTNADSLTRAGTCSTACAAGNPGTVEEGDVISYQLTFHNPSNTLLYFATDALANYDLMPANLNMTGQAYSLAYTEAGGTTITPWESSVSATGTFLIQTTPYADGTSVDGLTMRDNRIYQQGNSAISVGPGARVILTVAARVTGDVGDVLTNQVISGFSTTGNNTANLRLTDTGVETIKSNYVTHHIERGTILRKWVYSDTSEANHPATHAPLCVNANNMIISAGCTAGVCTSGTAKLQKGNRITYALTMDNSQSTRRARNINGMLWFSDRAPGGEPISLQVDDQIPQGLLPDVTTVRAYVTDQDGNNVSIQNGMPSSWMIISSSLEAVNENGSIQMREVVPLTMGGTHIALPGSMSIAPYVFYLANLNLFENAGQWTWRTVLYHMHNPQDTSAGWQDPRSYTITYLFDAEVTGDYDGSVTSNNQWTNQWEQRPEWYINNPETRIAVAPHIPRYVSNNVVQMRAIEGVDTSFTKVAAEEPTLGLVGAEFALYRWDGSNDPTTIEQNHMVNPGVLVDNTLPGGDWVRITYGGAVATSLSDVFLSANTPLGEVDFGKLKEGVYTLVETNAPAGYETPIGQWVLTIDPAKGDTGMGDYKIEFAGKSHSMMSPAAIRIPSATGPTYQVINAKPFTIGMSGLAGTKGILLTGFAIMVFASNAYIVLHYKRKKKDKLNRRSKR